MGRSLIVVKDDDLSTPAIIDINNIKHACLFSNYIILQTFSGMTYNAATNTENIHRIIKILGEKNEVQLYLINDEDRSIAEEEDPCLILHNGKIYLLNPATYEYEESHSNFKYILSILLYCLKSNPDMFILIFREKASNLNN